MPYRGIDPCSCWIFKQHTCCIHAVSRGCLRVAFLFEIRVVKSVSGAYNSQLTKNAPMEQMNPYASAHLQSDFQTNIHTSQSIYCSR
jgi:hypothetical protein